MSFNRYLYLLVASMTVVGFPIVFAKEVSVPLWEAGYRPASAALMLLVILFAILIAMAAWHDHGRTGPRG